MKGTIFRNLIFCLLAFLIAAPVFCQEGPDDWEKFHNSYQPPEKVMAAMGIKPGMIIGEVGAGRGRYAVQMAHKVGKAGKIYANDIETNLLTRLVSFFAEQKLIFFNSVSEQQSQSTRLFYLRETRWQS